MEVRFSLRRLFRSAPVLDMRSLASIAVVSKAIAFDSELRRAMDRVNRVALFLLVVILAACGSSTSVNAVLSKYHIQRGGFEGGEPRCNDGSRATYYDRKGSDDDDDGEHGPDETVYCGLRSRRYAGRAMFATVTHTQC